MQPDKFQKIKSSVQGSVFLNGAEKAEWLGLADVMSDRQLLELEKILNEAAVSANQSLVLKDQLSPVIPKVVALPEAPKVLTGAPVKNSESVEVQQKSLPSKSALLPQVLVLAEIPFSHILNFPKAKTGELEKVKIEKKPVTQESPALVSQSLQPSIVPKKPNPFLAKLKAIMGEKELPSGKYKELPAPPAVNPVLRSVPPIVPIPHKPSQPRAPILSPVIAKIAPVVPAAPVMQPVSALKVAEHKPVSLPLKEPVKTGHVHFPEKHEVKKEITKLAKQVGRQHHSHTVHASNTKEADRKPDNVTINVVVQSPVDISKIRDLARGARSSEQVIQALSGSPSLAQASPGTVSEPSQNIVPVSGIAPVSIPFSPAAPVQGQPIVQQPVISTVAVAAAPAPQVLETKTSAVIEKQVVVSEQTLEAMVKAAQDRTAKHLQEKEAEERLYAKPQAIVVAAPAAKSDTIVFNINTSESKSVPVATASVAPTPSQLLEKVGGKNKVPAATTTINLQGQDSASSTGNSVPAEHVAPGLNFPELFKSGPLKVKFDGMQFSGSLPGVAVPKAAKINLTEKPGDFIKLEALEDVASIKVEDLQQHATGTIVRQLRVLVSKFGYFDVVFNLENSPLFKTYINTGHKLLKDDATVEKLEKTSKEVLSKEDFEHFTDLLIVFKSAA